jgi:hypothetical protein
MTVKQLSTYFGSRLLDMVDALNRKPVFWEEAMDRMPSLLPGHHATVQVWDREGEFQAALDLGLDVILSNDWYVSGVWRQSLPCSRPVLYFLLLLCCFS